MKPTPSLAHCVWLGHPLQGAHPAAWQSQFRGCARTSALASAFVRCAMESLQCSNS